MTELFANLIQSLLRGFHTRELVRGENPPMANPVLIAMYGRLLRLGRRFAALAEKALNGTLRPLPERAEGGVRRRAAADADARADAGPARLRVPNGFLWFHPVSRLEGAAVACGLRHLLGLPEMAALVALDPVRFGRLLRALCRAVGVKTTEGGLLALPRFVARVPAPRKSRALPLSPMPRYGYERAMPRKDASCRTVPAETVRRTMSADDPGRTMSPANACRAVPPKDACRAMAPEGSARMMSPEGSGHTTQHEDSDYAPWRLECVRPPEDSCNAVPADDSARTMSGADSCGAQSLPPEPPRAWRSLPPVAPGRAHARAGSASFSGPGGGRGADGWGLGKWELGEWALGKWGLGGGGRPKTA